MQKELNYWSCYSVTTDAITGIGTLNIQIPGTYTGITPVDSGRTILNSFVSFASPSMGDRITAITVTDTDSVMPTNDRSFFPNYPVLGVYGDPGVSSGNKVLFLTFNGWTNFIPSMADGVFIPSQIWINITFQKSTTVADTAYINLQWQNLVFL